MEANKPKTPKKTPKMTQNQILKAPISSIYSHLTTPTSTPVPATTPTTALTPTSAPIPDLSPA
jgi:hypothetical protein